jgi:hypothetical protein
MATTAGQSTFYIYTLMLQDLGVLVWDNVEKRVMVVTRYGHDDVKRFWKRQRQANSCSEKTNLKYFAHRIHVNLEASWIFN